MGRDIYFVYCILSEDTVLSRTETLHTKSSLRLVTVGSMVTSLDWAICASIAFSWMLVKL